MPNVKIIQKGIRVSYHGYDSVPVQEGQIIDASDELAAVLVKSKQGEVTQDKATNPVKETKVGGTAEVKKSAGRSGRKGK